MTYTLLSDFTSVMKHITILRCIYFFQIIFLYSVWWILPMNVALFCRQVASIYKGLTPYEMDRKLSLKNIQTFPQKLKTVFGQFWILNFYFPAVLVYRQEKDGTNWNNIKIIYKCKPGERRPLQKQNRD